MLFNEEVRLRIQFSDDGLTIIAGPNKGEPGEEIALQAVEYIARELARRGVAIEEFKRKTQSGGRRVDMISTIMCRGSRCAINDVI